jgi:hypothetical protein
MIAYSPEETYLLALRKLASQFVQNVSYLSENHVNHVSVLMHGEPSFFNPILEVDRFGLKTRRLLEQMQFVEVALDTHVSSSITIIAR